MKQGSVFGGVLLITGSCIGAGMLALPVVTGLGGFQASLIILLLLWLFMTATAFLLLEVNLVEGYQYSLISLAKMTLGKTAKWVVILSFIFLFYCLSISYIAVSGPIVQSICADLFNFSIQEQAGGIFFTVFFGIVLMWGTRGVDYINRFLMLGLIIGYLGLVLLGVKYVQLKNLSQSYMIYAIASAPVIVVSFGFHNMIPTIIQYLHGDRKRVMWTIFLGSLGPLIVYVIWEIVMLGVIAPEKRPLLLQALSQGQAITAILHGIVGKTWVYLFAQIFALFAVVTSFLAQSLSLIDFFADGFKSSKKGLSRVYLILLVLVPPLLLALTFPNIFIHALNLAGGLSAVVLFGMIPIFMSWKLRKQKLQILPIGKFVLTILFLFALTIFGLELAQELGLSLIPLNVEAV